MVCMKDMRLPDQVLRDICVTVWRYYIDNSREMPWRKIEQGGVIDPYYILVSELMLQQTQVSRVRTKYLEFIGQFPDFTSLASADLGAVLAAWQGLGYNRRAKYLHDAAKMVVERFRGILPMDQTELTKLPGVGTNTAGAICAYAFNQPVVFIETNVRTVFLYHCFNGQQKIGDTDLFPLVARTVPGLPGSLNIAIDEHTPTVREWYWALMDYGAYLKTTQGNATRQSAHYRRQPPLKGSRRQIRGHVLRLLVSAPHSMEDLQRAIPDGRLQEVLTALEDEGLIQHRSGLYVL